MYRASERERECIPDERRVSEFMRQSCDEINRKPAPERRMRHNVVHTSSNLKYLESYTRTHVRMHARTERGREGGRGGGREGERGGGGGGEEGKG